MANFTTSFKTDIEDECESRDGLWKVDWMK